MTAVIGWWAESFMYPTGIASAEAFGSVSVARRFIGPPGIASAEEFGTAAVTAGAVSVAPTGIASAEAFGATVVIGPPQTLAPTGIESAEAVGDATVGRGAVTVAPTGIASAEAIGTAAVTRGAVTVAPTGIASAEAFGTATVSQVQVIAPTGIASAEAFGTAQVVKHVKYDAVSSQAPTLASSWSYSHTASAGAYVVLGLVADRAVTLTNVKYDGNTMTLLGSQKLNNGSTAELFMYGIAGVAGGAKTVSGTITSSYFTVDTISFLDVGSAGTVSKAYGTGSSLSQGSITCPTGKMTVQMFGTGTGATTYTSLSGGTNKLNTTANGSTLCINIATADATFAATGAAQPWAGLASVLSY